MCLLIRDPRENDVPKLFNLLDSLNTDCWPITSGLLRYDLKNIPVKQDIPESVYLLKIKTPEQLDNPYDNILSEIFLRFAQKYKNIIYVEDTLYHYDFQGLNWSIDEKEIYLFFLTSTHLSVGHSIIGTNYQY